MPKISVNLVTWNGEKYLPYLFKSLREQIFSDWELLVIDNASTDATVAALRQELTKLTIPSRLILNKDNKGFAGGHNQGFRESRSEWVLLLNQDMYLAPDCLSRLADSTGIDSSVAALTPRLMKWNFPEGFSDTIDSLGLQVFRNRRVIDCESGKQWRDSGIDKKEVFGVSGALPLYRRAALEQVLLGESMVFDESYHSYKEDVDLAWRLQSAGYKSFLVSSAVGHHDRSAGLGENLGDWAGVKNKQTQSFFVQYYSYKNHLATLYKNEFWQNFILDLPWILWYELKKFVYFFLFNRKVLTAWKDLYLQRKWLNSTRSKSNIKINSQTIRRFFV